MERLRKILQEGKLLHHAYLLTGLLDDLKHEVAQFLRNDAGVRIEGNPDVMTFHFSSLGVEDARELHEHTSRKPFSGKQYFLLSFSFATPEAQNALLKIFEEPNIGTHFFVFTPSVGTLLPTLRSRLIRLDTSLKSRGDRGKRFLSSTPKERMAMLKPAFEDKDKEILLTLITDLEGVYAQSLGQKDSKASLRAADALFYARRYLETKSASVKMIGEYLSSVLPNK